MRFHRPQTLCGAAVQDFVICPDSRRPCLERVYMSRTLVIAAIAAVAMPGASAHGSGAWLDTHHTKEGKDHAGVRYISESPPHVLTMVGSDDGATWWTLKVRATPRSRGHVQQLAIAAKSAARHASALTFRALETRAFDSVRAGAMVMA